MSEQKAPSHQLERFIVRLPDGMRDALAEAAHANRRSMNAEIVQRLQDSFEVVELRENLRIAEHRLTLARVGDHIKERERDLLFERIERLHAELVGAAERLAKADPKFAAQQEKLKKQAKAAAKKPRRM